MSVTTQPTPSKTPERSPLLERPDVRPAGVRDVIRDVGALYAANGVIGLVFSASGPIAVTLAVGAAGSSYTNGVPALCFAPSR